MRLALERGDPYELLARLWREETGEPLPPIARMPGGKPWFPDCPQAHFSVSRSGVLAFCALSAFQVGVDVETVRPRRAGFPRYVLSDREFAFWERQGGDWPGFYAFWTLKEALVKCTGQGLRRPPREIQAPPLKIGQKTVVDGRSFCLCGGDGFVASVCGGEKELEGLPGIIGEDGTWNRAHN